MRFCKVIPSILATAISFSNPALAIALLKPPAFYLAGDSTTAAQSSVGGGWGVGFLKTLTLDAIGTDLGSNGATTESFESRGAWANVLDAVYRSKSHYEPYVTIQFGHNDQRPSLGITPAQYRENLISMALQVRSAGGTPILVTSLSRRKFDSSGKVIEDLAEQRNIPISVAEEIGSDYIDLNEASTVYLNAIGANAAASYNHSPNDYTHLNPSGSVVFGNMVSWLLTTRTSLGKSIWLYTAPDPEVVGAIRDGHYILPDAE